MKGGLGPVGLLMKSVGSSAVEINSCAHWSSVPSRKLTASLLGRGGETGWGRVLRSWLMIRDVSGEFPSPRL